MITIRRGAEPNKLAAVRVAQLMELRALGREPSSKEIDGYRVVAEDLWRLQHCKCCYCEARIPMKFNDVEHYRPKGSADRSPGSALTHGYWWLAFTWDNLLFACPSCNRSGKNDLFPLDHGSVPLNAEDSSPGREIPLLIDPSSATNPVEHIEFVKRAAGPTGSPKQWWARPRNGSAMGSYTISVFRLNNSEYLELRDLYYKNVIEPQIRALKNTLAPTFEAARFNYEFDRALAMLRPQNEYVALTYDALCAELPNTLIERQAKVVWPRPADIGV